MHIDAKIELLSSCDLGELFRVGPDCPVAGDVEAFARALADSLETCRGRLVDACVRETGLTRTDADESIEGCLGYLRQYRLEPAVNRPRPTMAGRRLEVVTAPWGTIVAILPQNAFLYLGLACLTNALAAGNRVVLRVPSGSHDSAGLLSVALAVAGGMSRFVSLIEAPAREVLESFYSSRLPGLVHYFGGSTRIPDVIAGAFRAGKGCIADGEGNTWVYVDQGCEPGLAAETLASGATRYCGQTCTSVNGAIVHPALFEQVARLLRDRLSNIQAGSLGDPDAAQTCLDRLLSAGGELLAGGDRIGAEMSPTLVGHPLESSALVREGLFGPGMWIASGEGSDFRRLWLENRFPLCAGVLGSDVDVLAWSGLPNLARLVVNGDPSLEDPLEPWGGYPCSGNSSVDSWSEKYRRTVQVDQP